MTRFISYLDLFAAIVLLLSLFGVLNPLWLVFAASFIIIKGWVYFLLKRSFGSVVDLSIGFILFLSTVFSMPLIVMILIFLWLIQKFIYNFI